jgi:glycosyltransferase involved in cell wall biosynthesis
MNIIILYENPPEFGGMETLLLRIYDYFVGRGFNVFCILRYDVYSARGHLRKNMEFLGKDYKRLISRRFLIRQTKKFKIADVRLAIAMDLFSALIGPLFSTIQSNEKCIAIASNWGPGYFSMQKKMPCHPMSVVQSYNLKKNYCKDRILFMSSQYISDGREVLGSQWDATLFPLPISVGRYSLVERNPDRKIIVSVGRLSSMKEYNFYMVNVMEQLIAKGYDIFWHIYGDGDYKTQVMKAVERSGLMGRVKLWGELPYENFPEVLARAGYFVGMGTSVLEASAAGVPNIVAVAYDTSGITHGPLYAQEYGNLGEIVKTQTLIKVEDEVQRLLLLSDDDYHLECSLNAKAAKEYDEKILLPKLEDRLALKPICPSCFFYLFLEGYEALRWFLKVVCKLK